MPAAPGAIELSRGFPPVIGRAPRVLLLGSLPGRASLAAGEYYAQPQNAFWRILGAVCGAGPGQSYAARLRLLKRAGIAIWDVLAAAERPGSLDADIVRSSVRVNDIPGLLGRHRSIELVAFNGKAAAAIYRRHFGATVLHPRVRLQSLPSTSPAYASMAVEQKLVHWREALLHCIHSD
jgi:hypoxanthine-DNA glycosylase